MNLIIPGYFKKMVFDFNDSTRFNARIKTNSAYLETSQQIADAISAGELTIVEKHNQGWGYGNEVIDEGNYAFIQFKSIQGVIWELVAPDFPASGVIRNFEGPGFTALYEDKWANDPNKPYEFIGDLL